MSISTVVVIWLAAVVLFLAAAACVRRRPPTDACVRAAIAVAVAGLGLGVLVVMGVAPDAVLDDRHVRDHLRMAALLAALWLVREVAVAMKSLWTETHGGGVEPKS